MKTVITNPILPIRVHSLTLLARRQRRFKSLFNVGCEAQYVSLRLIVSFVVILGAVCQIASAASALGRARFR